MIWEWRIQRGKKKKHLWSTRVPSPQCNQQRRRKEEGRMTRKQAAKRKKVKPSGKRKGGTTGQGIRGKGNGLTVQRSPTPGWTPSSLQTPATCRFPALSGQSQNPRSFAQLKYPCTFRMTTAIVSLLLTTQLHSLTTIGSCRVQRSCGRAEQQGST